MKNNYFNNNIKILTNKVLNFVLLFFVFSDQSINYIDVKTFWRLWSVFFYWKTYFIIESVHLFFHSKS